MTCPYVLLKRNLFDSPTLFTGQLLQAFEHFRADARCVIGEINQVPRTILKNLKTESVFPMEGNQCAINGLDAASVVILLAGGAYDHRDLSRRVILVLFLFCQWDINGRRNLRTFDPHRLDCDRFTGSLHLLRLFMFNLHGSRFRLSKGWRA